MSEVSSVKGYDESLLRELYRYMRLIRDFEHAREKLIDSVEVPGHAHLYFGQEAVAVGACRALRTDDVIGSTHRGIGHILAKGSDPKDVLAEFGGRVAGLCGGRGGEMHMFDPQNGVLETSAMVGANAPHVAGAMLSGSLDDDDRVGITFFGEGGSNQGVIYETMNLSAIWDLPVIFLCENNRYQVTTPREYSTAGDQISDRAQGFGIPGETIDGQDVLSVYETISAAVDRARNGGGPQFVECETYRFSGHYSLEHVTLADRTYRSEEEVREWRENRDPIELLRRRVVDAGILSDTDLDEIDREVAALVDDAISHMRGSEYPSEDRVLDEVYADQEYQNTPAEGYR